MSHPDFYHDPEAPYQPMQYDWEFRKLLDFYRKKKPVRVLEIGVDWGGTLYQWIKHNRSKFPVICAVDAVGWNWSSSSSGGNKQEWQTWASMFNVALYPVLGDSHDPNMVDEMRSHGPYDWVFIDGDHSYEGAKADFDNCLPMLAPGGVVVFHDIVKHPGDDRIGVWRLWAELNERYKMRTMEFITSPDQEQCGIGILFARPEAI